jgi:pyruvate formate lyase activating enzyme|tara:strand:+ start:1076 stop:2023 length:948 start_codon:yes stop_codon:yes gene_type:complete
VTGQLSGRIFDVQRFSIHDGPGIRTTVFLKGCPLRCQWCHNPEGISPRQQLSFLQDKCVDCGFCFEACPEGAHHRVNGQHAIDRQACAVCGRCTEKCRSQGLEIVGREATVAEIIGEVLRDLPFYETSDGGMTLSGGEPLLQVEFCAALLQAGREAGLHCVVETCGHSPWERYERVLPWLDMVLFDLKETDPDRHVRYTGVDNKLILANLYRLHEAGATILLRLPIVPGMNDRAAHFRAIAGIAGDLPDLLGVEVMPYHRLGLSKIQRFGLPEASQHLQETETPDAAVVRGWIETLSDFGVNVINELPGTTVRPE